MAAYVSAFCDWLKLAHHLERLPRRIAFLANLPPFLVSLSPSFPLRSLSLDLWVASSHAALDISHATTTI